MKHPDKQPRRPSNEHMPQDKRQPASDVSPHAAKGGDKESNEPLHRPLEGGSEPQSSPGQKSGR